MLIYPTITLQDGRCRSIFAHSADTPECYPDDPVAAARQWRTENCKALHVVDLDGARDGIVRNLGVIRAIVTSLDVPVQVCGGIRDHATAEILLNDIGVARVVLTTAPFENSAMVRRLIAEHGRKIAFGLDLRGVVLHTHGRARRQETTLDEYARMVRDAGVQRVVVTNLDGISLRRQTDVDILLRVAHACACKVTACGYVWGFQDLRTMQGLLPRIIDSLILDEPLYADVFPCQQIWRIAGGARSAV